MHMQHGLEWPFHLYLILQLVFHAAALPCFCTIPGLSVVCRMYRCMCLMYRWMCLIYGWMGVQELANAGQTKRPTSCLMVLKDHPKPEGVEADESLQELYTEVEAKMKKLDQK
jgi:hypothetical protein